VSDDVTPKSLLNEIKLLLGEELKAVRDSIHAIELAFSDLKGSMVDKSEVADLDKRMSKLENAIAAQAASLKVWVVILGLTASAIASVVVNLFTGALQ